MPDLDFPPGLLDYFAAREEQRERDIAGALPDLEQRMAEFVTAHAGGPGLPVVLARMIREAAVQAWARATPCSERVPTDSVIFYETLCTIRSGESCAAWRIFDGRHVEEEGDDA